MILFIDNYDSFTYNLVQFCGSVNPDIKVVRNDEITVEEIEKLNLRIKEKEGNKILNSIKDNMYVITLDLRGKMLSSEELAKFIDNCGVRGDSNLCFVIGGSLGLSDAVLKRANYSLCFSKMTFPHQLFRVMLLEQIYRGFRINNNEPYHK